MKKLLVSFYCLIILVGIMGCNSMRDVTEEDSNETTAKVSNSSEESEADINNLFVDTHEIESIKTMRIDIQYTLDTQDKIDELMERLEDIEYTIDDTKKSIDEAAPEEEKATGSSTNGMSIMFYYKDGSRKSLAFSSAEEGDLVEYTEIAYEPYKEKTQLYTTGEQVWNHILEIMKKGEKKDLNE